jgi:hypothetical protein
LPRCGRRAGAAAVSGSSSGHVVAGKVRHRDRAAAVRAQHGATTHQAVGLATVHADVPPAQDGAGDRRSEGRPGGGSSAAESGTRHGRYPSTGCISAPGAGGATSASMVRTSLRVAGSSPTRTAATGTSAPPSTSRAGSVPEAVEVGQHDRHRTTRRLASDAGIATSRSRTAERVATTSAAHGSAAMRSAALTRQ